MSALRNLKTSIHCHHVVSMSLIPENMHVHLEEMRRPTLKMWNMSTRKKKVDNANDSFSQN